MTDRELLELIATQVGNLTNQVSTFTKDMTEIKTKLISLEDQLNSVDDRLDTVEKIVVRIENDHGQKLKALFDAREVQNDINERIISTLNRIEAKLDVLQMETAHIRRIK